MGIEHLINDPNWKEVQDKFQAARAPFQDVRSIDTNQPSEVVHAQVVGMQHALNYIDALLQQTRLLEDRGDIKKTSFR